MESACGREEICRSDFAARRWRDKRWCQLLAELSDSRQVHPSAFYEWAVAAYVQQDFFNVTANFAILEAPSEYPFLVKIQQRYQKHCPEMVSEEDLAFRPRAVSTML